jgi:glutamine synthetase type III
MVERMVLPEALGEISSLESLSAKSTLVARKEKDLLGLVDDTDASLIKLKAALTRANTLEDKSGSGLILLKDVTPLMLEVRNKVDTLEALLPSKSYPLPSYLEMLFMLD